MSVPSRKRRTKRLLAVVLGAMAAVTVSECAVRLVVPVRNIGPSFVVYDAVYGRRLKRNASFISSSPEFSFQFSTNCRGQRDPQWESPPAGAMLCLGDSYTMGYGVDDRQAFPRVLEGLLRKEFGERAKVVNGGVGNAGNGHWLKFLRREGREYSPRCVIVQMSINDFGDNIREGLFTLDEKGDLVEHQAPPPGILWTAQKWLDEIPGLSRSHLVALARQAVLAQVRRNGRARSTPGGEAPAPCTLPTRQLTWKLLEESLEECRRNGWPAVAFAVGFPIELQQEFEAICASHAAAVIRVPLKSERPDLYFRVDGHWRGSGHEHVAELLADKAKQVLAR